MTKPFDPDARLAELLTEGGATPRFEIRIDRNGDWFYQGSKIGRIELVKLFANVLRRAPDGGYWLVTPVEHGRIEVEDVPFTIVEMQSAGEGRQRRIGFRTNLDHWVEAGPDHPLTLRPPALDHPGDDGLIPYVTLDHGLEARLLRPVYYELAELAEPAPEGEAFGRGDDRPMGVWSHGEFFVLDRIVD